MKNVINIVKQKFIPIRWVDGKSKERKSIENRTITVKEMNKKGTDGNVCLIFGFGEGEMSNLN